MSAPTAEDGNVHSFPRSSARETQSDSPEWLLLKYKATTTPKKVISTCVASLGAVDDGLTCACAAGETRVVAKGRACEGAS